MQNFLHFRYFFFSLLLITVNSFSQTIIKGKVFTPSQKPLSDANIVITEEGSAAIYSYSISNDRGEYILNYSGNKDSLNLTVSFLGYEKQKEKVANKSQVVDFFLLEAEIELEEVFLKAPPIEQKKDTISYFIDSFKNQKDRVIGDVLAKLPGIEVLQDGRIKYQGKSIEKYYIEGLDLLEGKYNLANNSLPADAVTKVQILENHQPIKILDSLVFSDKASLNIQLKKNITLTGSARLGAGVSPFLWDVDITPLLLTKKNQVLTSYQSNNTGNNLADELKTFSLEKFNENEINFDAKKDFVNILEIAPPNFDGSRWFENNAHLLSYNYLKRLKKDVDFKVDFSYLNDVQNQIGRTETSLFTATDTTNITEIQNNALFYNSMSGNIVIEKNTNKSYFKNNFEINSSWDSKNGEIQTEESIISQTVDNPFTSLNNKLKWILPIGNKLATVNSNIAYTRTPQNLFVSPGQYANLLNEGKDYSSLIQELKLKNFHTENSLNFVKNYGAITVTPTLGVLFQKQNLSSNISTLTNNSKTTLNGIFQNSLKFEKSLFYLNLISQYTINSWKFELKAPLKFQSFNRSDVLSTESESLNQLTFEPQILVKNEFNAFWKANANVGIRNTFGNIEELYYNFILNNYRSIKRFDSPLPRKKNISGNLNLAYRNPLTSTFFTTSYSYQNTNKNLLMSNLIESDGSQTIVAAEQDNVQSSQIFSLQGSKFFSNSNTLISVGANTFNLKGEQLLNEEITEVVTQKYQLDVGLQSELNEWFDLEYKGNISFLSTIINGVKINDANTQQHILNFNIYPSENQFIGLKTEYYNNNLSQRNEKNYFMDFKYRYTFLEKKIDLEFNVTNIFGMTNYTTVLNDAFSNFQSTYFLRPRQLLISITFIF